LRILSPLTQITETVEAYGNSGSSVAVTTATANIWSITLNSAAVSISLAGSGGSVAEALTLYLTQDGTGGRTASWPGSVTWLSGSAAAINPTPGGLTVIVLETLNGGTTWYGSASDLALPLAVGNGGTGQVSLGTAGQLLTSNGTAGAWQGLLSTVFPPVTSATAIGVNQVVPVDATSASVTLTLPGGGFAGQLAGAKLARTASSNTVTIATTAPDLINLGTGLTAAAAVTTLQLSLLNQGSLLSYSGPGVPVTAAFTASANLVQGPTTATVAPISVGEVVYLATSVPGGFTAATPYYVLSNAQTVVGSSYDYTYTLASTYNGLAISATGSGTTHLVPCGIWTVLSDDLPLGQLDLRYGLMTTVGDLLYEGTGPAPTRLAGSTSATKNFLTQTGTGSASAAPAWGTLASGDIPNNAASTSGTAAGLSAQLAITSGGTNAITAAAALTSLGAAPIAGATFTGYTAPCVVTLTDAAPVVITPSQGNDFRLLLTTAVGPTRQLQNPSGTYYDGQRILIHVTQPASGAAQFLTYGTSYLFATGLASPTLTTTNGYVDLLGFIYNNTLGKFMFAMFVNGYA
jgi:hypothetical protein